MKVNKAVILAAGKGTRFLPYTKAYPKEMLAVVDKPALELIVEEITTAGITDVLLVLSPDKKKIIEHFTKDESLVETLRSQSKFVEADAVERLNNLANVGYVFQESVTGTGKAVELAKNFVGNEPFVVLNGDDVIFNKGKSVTRQLVEAYEKVNKTVVGVQEVDRDSISKYASCKVVSSKGRLHLIADIVEKPQTEEEIFSLLAPLGRYVLTPEIFEVIENTNRKASGEVYLTDSLQILAKAGGIYAYEFEGHRYDFGDKLGYLKGVTEYALRSEEFGDRYKEYLKELVKTLK